MDVYLGNISSPKTGRGFFLKRLSEELSLYNDVNLIFDSNEKHDISLHLSKIKKRTNAKKNIIRLDGVYHNTSIDYKNRNKIIAKSVHKSNGVIYQSNFGKRIANKYLGEFKGPSVVIFNGADPNFYNNVDLIESKFDHVFLTSSKWRPHKRLRDTIESFLLSSVKSSCLYVAGNLRKSGLTQKEIRKYFSLSNVKYLEVLKQKELSRYLLSSSAFIHLCWTDCCPNGVVEAICAKRIVICGNEGGTKEIVAPSGGYVCDIDKSYNLEACNLYSPPAIKREIVADAINSSVKGNRIIDKDHVDIKNIAKKYKNFFEVVMQN